MHPHQTHLVLNIISQIVFGLLAMTICLPSLPFWSEQFGEVQSQVQLTFSGFVAMYGAMQLVYGPISDRWGRRQVLILGLLVALLASIWAALASSLTGLVLARVLQGAGCAASMVVSRALVQDHFQGADRTRVMAFIGMAMGLCPPTATLLGGQLHVWLGWRSNFVFLSLLAVLLMVMAWKGIPASPPASVPDNNTKKPPAASWFAAYRTLLQDTRYLFHVGVLALTTTTFYTFLSGAPLVLNSYGVEPNRMGLYIMCIPLMYILGNYLTSRWVRHGNDHRLMILGQCFTLVGLATMLGLAAARVHHPLALSLPLMILGVGHGMLMPTALSGTVGLIPSLAGSAAAFAGLAQQLTGALGGYMVGFVHHDEALPMGLQMLASASLATVCLWAVVRRPVRL